MDFPITELRDEDAGYRRIGDRLHPDGRAGPRCGAHAGRKVHRRSRAPVLDYRCTACKRVFNAFTGTVFQKTHRRPSEIILILRGIAPGASTARLARELKRNRPHLTGLRHRLQEQAAEAAPRGPLDDPVVEADAMSQNAGRTGGPHTDPLDPPRRRANKRPGPGRFAHDRPPGAGVVGRTSGRVRLEVVAHSDRATREPRVVAATRPGAVVNTDEWRAYAPLPERGRGHARVCHAAGEWARDADGDGVRAVHCNTQEGGGTGLRNFRRDFRGVSKHY